MSNPNSADITLNHTIRMKQKSNRMGPYSKEIILAGLEKESAEKLLAFVKENNMYAIVKHVGLDPPEGKRISSYKKTLIKYLTSFVQDEQAATAANDAALAAAVAKNSMVPASATNTAAAAIDAAAGGAAVGVLATNVAAPDMVPVTPNARTGAGGYATPNVGVELQYAMTQASKQNETTSKTVESLAVSTGNVHKLAESAHKSAVKNSTDLNRLTGIVENISGEIGEVKERTGRLEGRTDRLEGRTDQLQDEIVELKQQIDAYTTPKKANDSAPKKGSAIAPKKVKFAAPKKAGGKKDDGSIIDKENRPIKAIMEVPKNDGLRYTAKRTAGKSENVIHPPLPPATDEAFYEDGL